MKDAALAEIIAGYSHEQIQQVQQVKGSSQVNDVFIVITTANSKYVVRIDPAENTSDRFDKERWCMGAAEAVGVMVPKILASGMKDGHPYMLITFIDGINGEEVDKQSQKLIWLQLGEFARKIHSVKVTGFGEKMVDPGKFWGSWEEYLNYNVSSLNDNDELLARNLITKEESQAIKDVFQKLKSTQLIFGLVHGDLSLKNTIYKSERNTYLLDWGSAEVNVIPHMDFAEVLYSSLNEDSEEFNLFLQGYEMNQADFKKIKNEIDSLQLLRCADKLRWALDRKPELIDHKAEEFRDVFTRAQAV